MTDPKITEFWPINDGYGSTAWAFQCPECSECSSFSEYWQSLCYYWDEIIECEHCGALLKSPGDSVDLEDVKAINSSMTIAKPINHPKSVTLNLDHIFDKQQKGEQNG